MLLGKWPNIEKVIQHIWSHCLLSTSKSPYIPFTILSDHLGGHINIYLGTHLNSISLSTPLSSPLSLSLCLSNPLQSLKSFSFSHPQKHSSFGLYKQHTCFTTPLCDLGIYLSNHSSYTQTGHYLPTYTYIDA